MVFENEHLTVMPFLVLNATLTTCHNSPPRHVTHTYHMGTSQHPYRAKVFTARMKMTRPTTKLIQLKYVRPNARRKANTELNRPRHGSDVDMN
jgi:hypothetical protein